MDIVERMQRDLDIGCSASIGDTKKAIAEIERLREALDCYTCDCKEDVCKERYLNCGQAARYALEGKNDG